MDAKQSQQMMVAIVGNKRGHLVDLLDVGTFGASSQRVTRPRPSSHGILGVPEGPVGGALMRTNGVNNSPGFFEALDEVVATLPSPLVRCNAESEEFFHAALANLKKEE